ncbi:hypothetical protein [Polaribacter sp. SA4-10]|uniref:hypothetical protein n=1 Tax=Polaribacter sp. SA4-10 TaxID=754397 RepID=UPI0018DFD55C|nr:hypothetical protein [Polaribacter sp. SA4-10]
MKNLHKIFALFAFIFVTGIIITVMSINSSLNKIEPQKETVELQRDTLSLLKTEQKTV